VADPLAAFIGGDLAWRPAPSERRFVANDLYVQRRERIEKVVWRGVTYYRQDWQGIARHAPRRITDTRGGVGCGLWALEQPLEEHLRLGASGDLSEIVAVEPAPAASRPLPPDVWPGVVATVAARAAPPLGPFVEAVGGAFSLEWGPVARDVINVGRGRVRLTARLREALVARLAAAPARADRAALGLATIVEIASLVGDELRGRAQAELVRRGPDALPDAAESSGRSGAERARAITAAVAALLADATD